MKHLLLAIIRCVLSDKPAWLFIVFLTACTINLKAQSLYDTTLTIPEVIISAPRPWHFRNDIKTDVFTSEDLQPFEGESLGRFLIGNTALNVKAYGTGGALSNVSLRGSSTSHVQVNWNGFPVNSATLGSCDFSMIPATGFDRISVVYGAPGALYGSGTFGGAINLDNNLKLEKTLSGSTSISYESLRTLNGSATTTIGNNNIVWKGNFWGAVSDNEFTYYDYIRQSNRKQTDGKWNNSGTIQQLLFRLTPTSTLEAGLWYQVKDYDIPSRIGSVSFESQKDSTLKLYSAYKKSANRWGLQIKAAAFNDYQRFTQKASAQSTVYSIDSRIISHQYYGDANFRYYLKQGISFDAGLAGSYITAEVSAYGETKKEKGITAFTGAKYERNELTIQAGIRSEMYADSRSGLLPSLGIAWEMIPDKHKLRFNISKKYRNPTFNDLFWMPGGNPDLKPESGYSVEAGSVVTFLKKENIKMTADLGAYWSQIDNMIVWRPDGAYWTAKNYQRVRSGGMDGNLLFDLIRGRYKYHSSLKVMLNRSGIKTYTGNHEKMLYSPGIITSWENKFSAGIIDLTISHHFTADRFYEENSLLKPYQTIDMQTGIRIPVGKGKLGIHFTVNNLTNASYELIRLYPMPGRYWSVKINHSY
jgi:outer membrane cobalamin receptor